MNRLFCLFGLHKWIDYQELENDFKKDGINMKALIYVYICGRCKSRNRMRGLVYCNE